ncbi:hypothetical protein NWP09_07535, partial [Agrococcus sp. HG114]|nr:hypothetical protein [Agrococcus sp. HG114]
MAAHEAASILLVCAANVCRSPMAALTLRQRFDGLAAVDQVRIASAGVSADAGSPVCPSVSAFHDDPEWREQAARHRSRVLDAEQVLGATLVLTASRAIRSSVAGALPERRDRVFTMREAAWLAQGFVREPGVQGADAVAALWRHL